MDQQSSHPPPIDYARIAPRNPAATASLVFGLLFFLFPFLPGILAIVLGRKGLRVGSQNGTGGAIARWGIALGLINLVLSLAVAVFLSIALVKARQAAMQVACMSNMRQIGFAVIMYANDNKGSAPPSLDALAMVRTSTNSDGTQQRMPGYLSNSRIFECPACVNDPSKPAVAMLASGPTRYHLVVPEGTMKLYSVKKSAQQVLMYEPIGSHGEDGANFLFYDGHVESRKGKAAQDLINSNWCQPPTTNPSANPP